MSGVDNLKPVRTTAEAKERGRKGGLAKARNNEKRKMLSQMYCEFLMKEHDIEISEEVKKKMSAQELVNYVTGKVLARGDSASVRMLAEMREATEGSKSTITIDEPIRIVKLIEPRQKK